jgi:perosamine synthetase
MEIKKNDFIPWAKPDYWGNEVEYATEALKSTWISGGPYVEKLEVEVQKILGTKNIFAVANGTAAIHLAYLGLGLQPGDEVIVPAFGFMAVANVALHMNLKPVFADVDPETWCITAETIERKITKKTRAIVPVHTYGVVCDMPPIIELAKRHGIFVIEDCAESFFSKLNGIYCGKFGDVSTFSLHATKTIATGEGGLTTCNDDQVADRIALYRSHGMRRKDKFYWHELPGHNFRLTNVQAAIGVAQLEQAEKILEARRRVFETYKQFLNNVAGLTLQQTTKGCDPVIWAVALLADSRFYPQGRDTLIQQLKSAGIETRPGFYSSAHLPIYEKHDGVDTAVFVSENVISLPSYPTLSKEQIQYIVHQITSLRK